MPKKLRDILSTLHAAVTVDHFAMDLPGFRLHPLKAQMKGFWAVTVRAEMAQASIFRFDDGATDVRITLIDYH